MSFCKTIPFLLAARTIIVINIVVIAFHLLVLTRVIPFDVVWGGRLQTEKEMYVFELVSIFINLILIVIVLTKIKKIKVGASNKLINFILWIFVVLFVLNTIGNLTSKTSLETYIATPMTFILALLCSRVAIEPSLRSPVQPDFSNSGKDL